MQIKSIKISSLSLDLENSRYPFSSESQRDAIVKMVELQGDKLVNLARDIIEYGMDPSERLIVLKENDTSYVVAEGNRRVTTLKLLNHPYLIGENSVTKKIKTLLKTNPSIPKEVDCVVYENEEDYEHWVSIKHTGENLGIGRVRWTGQESDRHRAKHGNTSLGNQLLSFLRLERDIPLTISRNIRELKITNINRLLSDPDVRDSLDLSVMSGVLYCYENKVSFISKILKAIECMLEVDDKGKIIFTVDRIRKKEDRKVFINELGLIKTQQKISRPWKVSEPDSFEERSNSESTDSPTNENDVPSSKDSNDGDKPSKGDFEVDGGGNRDKKNINQPVHPNPNRNNLVPATVRLKITDKKCSGIFKELKGDLRHDKQANSIAVLIRVFLDLSISFYIDSNSIQLERNKTGLHDKLVKVTQRLVELEKLTQKQCSAIQATSSNTLKSNGSLQQYVHNNHMFPDKLSINNTWDNFEPLFLAIWSE